MTEAEWNSCDDPHRLLAWLRRSGRGDERKRRLFICACCRRTWQRLDKRSQTIVEMVEEHAQAPDELEQWAVSALDERLRNQRASQAMIADLPLWWLVTMTLLSGVTDDGEHLARHLFWQSATLRDIFGNPFRPPPTLSPSVLTPDALALARAAYENRTLPEGTLEPARLAALADALEAAGCTDSEVLAHLRSPGPHTRGCWPLDIVLDKK